MELLPKATEAIVPIGKLRDYSLDPSHPLGKHKARVFASALGMTRSDAARLRDMILNAILTNPAVETGVSIHGRRYTVDFETLGRKGLVIIRTSWIVDADDAAPRMTSCFVRN